MIRSIHVAAAAALLMTSTSLSFAADNPPANVNFTLKAAMDSLRDNKRNDTFEATVGDTQVKTTLKLECSAGRSKWGGIIKSDEACAIAGNGNISNPKDATKWYPRTQYSGGYTVSSKDGYTDMKTLSIDYLPVGKTQASTTTYGGALMMKPENPSAAAAAIAKRLMGKLTGEGGGSVIDTRVDTVELQRVFVPSAGLPSDKGCTWSGDLIYTYQKSSWIMDLTANCNGAEYKLKGNMPWVDGDEGKATYNVILTLPSAEIASDDALFVSAEDDSDMFAAADGIAGTIDMTLGSFVTVKVDGADEELASQVDATGTLVGTNVPLIVVRSFATLIGLNARTFFGA